MADDKRPGASPFPLLERSFDLVMLIDRDRIVRYVNGASERVLGYPPATLVGRNLRHLLDDEREADDRSARFTALLRTPGAAARFRYQVRRADGARRTLEADAQNLLDDEAVRAIVVHSRDVTDDEGRAAELARSEARFRMIADSMHDAVVMFDAKGNIVYANAAVERTLGYRPDERVGRDMNEFIHPDDRALVRGAFATALETSYARIDALRVISADGGWRVVEGTAARLPEGRDGGVVVVSYRDITERHAMGLELERSERRFRALTERSGSSVVVADAEGRIRYANASVSLLGLALEERIGLSVFERVHPDDLERTKELWADVVRANGNVRRDDFRLLHKNGEWRWHDATWTNLLADPAVGGVVINNRDVTDRVLADEQLRKAHRLEAIGRLAAGVAHDFNNLLVGILGYASLLSTSLTDPERLEDVEQIKIAGERAADLTRQILAFSRRQLLKREHVDINDLLRGLVKLLKRVTRANVEIELVTGDGPLSVYADAGQLEHVIVNLAVNASDAMPDGGKLTIATGAVDVAADRGEPATRAGPHVSIRVSDTGSGMPADVVQHIFEPFFTTKELGRGTGLGLATVHGVVHQHDGRIRVDSAVGRGTTFEVLLPSAPAPAATTHKPRPAVGRGGNELVLVADDDEIARRITVRLLERAGYRVLVAHDGQEAIDLFARNPDIDLVLLDVVMPDMSGPVALSCMEKVRAGVRFLFASGYSWEPGEVDERITKRSLQKPFDLDELLRRVRAALDDGA